MIDPKTLPPGPHLRRVIAERLGWHMRKIWVGSGGIEYDYIVYDNDDRFVYQREIRQSDPELDQQAEDQTWLEAMNDEECPRWDEDLDEARDLVFGLDYDIVPHNGTFHAWVKSAQHTASAETGALALVRAWLSSTKGQNDFLGPG